MNIENLIGRSSSLFKSDLLLRNEEIDEVIKSSSFLVIGGAGSIGSGVVKFLFSRSPLKLHIVDLNENSLAELVRDVRSSFGYISGDFRTFCLDSLSEEFNSYIRSVGYFDFVLNLSAMKHVRSERDEFTLMRLLRVNIFNTIQTFRSAEKIDAKKYFAVSTDKATNPVNMMGASKRIMEKFLFGVSTKLQVSSARFANVAFSDGSLLQSFINRISKDQPIVVPNDIKRYFMTPEDSAVLCVLSCVFGEHRDVFIPKLGKNLPLMKIDEVAYRFVREAGYEPIVCATEQEARNSVKKFKTKGQWPVYSFSTDTTGEKLFEEFLETSSVVDNFEYESVSVIKNEQDLDFSKILSALSKIENLLDNGAWSKKDLVNITKEIISNFDHEDNGFYLDDKM